METAGPVSHWLVWWRLWVIPPGFLPNGLVEERQQETSRQRQAPAGSADIAGADLGDEAQRRAVTSHRPPLPGPLNCTRCTPVLVSPP